MEHKHKYTQISRIIKILCLGSIVFASSPSYAAYYGGGHYKHHYRHYPFHRTYYNYHHGYHRDYRIQYGVHAHLNETTAYVFLGVLGAALLTHIFTNNKSQYSNIYPKARTTVLPANVKAHALIKHHKPANKNVYHYNRNEGWKQLANGNANYALDIFAVQSQQNLNSGEPKVGFALAAAIIGEKERAIRAMRNAIRIDVNVFNRVDINTIKPAIQKLSNDYQSNKKDNFLDADTAFMVASLAYLQQDYVTAKSIITENDTSQSAINLRELVKNKL